MEGSSLKRGGGRGGLPGGVMEPDVVGNVEALAGCEREAGVCHGRAWQDGKLAMA